MHFDLRLHHVIWLALSKDLSDVGIVGVKLETVAQPKPGRCANVKFWERNVASVIFWPGSGVFGDRGGPRSKPRNYLGRAVDGDRTRKYTEVISFAKKKKLHTFFFNIKSVWPRFILKSETGPGVKGHARGLLLSKTNDPVCRWNSFQWNPLLFFSL